MQEINVPLLRKVVEWAEEQEQLEEGREWNQEYWFTEKEEAPWCGSTMCIAGKIAVMHGWKPRGRPGSVYVLRDGEELAVYHVAANILGLDQRDAFDLFDSTNTAKDIRRIAENYAGERL